MLVIEDFESVAEAPDLQQSWDESSVTEIDCYRFRGTFCDMSSIQFK